MSTGRGYNTLHGFDNGPPPPGFDPNRRPPGNHVITTGWYTSSAHVAYPPIGLLSSNPMAPQQPTLGFHGNYRIYPYNSVQPAPMPVNNGGIPGVHLRNVTGGVGTPLGYDYLFPKEHTQIHVFITKEKPWQIVYPLYSQDATKHVKLYVPSKTTVKELMQNLGCDNPEPKKNVIHEVTEAGNGKWVKGLTITGDDNDRMKKTIAEFGWDMSRTGKFGERPVVWLYITKD